MTSARVHLREEMFSTWKDASCQGSSVCYFFGAIFRVAFALKLGFAAGRSFRLMHNRHPHLSPPPKDFWACCGLLSPGLVGADNDQRLVRLSDSRTRPK